MHRHIRPLLTALAACAALACLAAPVSAQSAPSGQTASATQGAPDIDQNSPTGYYIWHDDNGWHLRTHGPGARHDFDARLHTNGTFENVDPVRLEDGDRVDVVDGGQGLVVQFHTFDFTDGVNFTLRDPDRLRFAARLDDHLIGTDRIFLGPDKHHPASNPFVVELGL
jgi:hypothetical protein